MIGSEEDIRLAERQLVAIELEERFQRNLAALNAVLPDAAARYADYQPTRFAIGLVEGQVSLVSPDGEAIYPTGYAALDREQVEAFCQAPAFLKCTSRPVHVLQEEDVVHSRNSNRAIDVLLATDREAPTQLPDQVSFLLHLGLKLGDGLSELLSRTDVRHLCIVEPDPDVFYASLMTFDWLALFERQMAPGHSLELIVGDGPQEWANQMLEYVNEIGAFNLARPYVLQHAMDAGTQAAGRVFIDQVMPRVTVNLGFFDDERVGLAHTLQNIRTGTPVLSGARPKLGHGPLPPVFLVANGPSLDDAFDTIREHRDQAILVSCGTALGSLTKAGIVPDIHLEIERDREIAEWLAASTTEAQRAQIQLIALNVVHPEVLALFPNRTIALKANDLGARHLLEMEPEGPRMPQLEDCNPTVANFALSLTEEFGFEDIYLFGLDLGFPKGDLHHSVNSPHYLIRESEADSVEIFRPDDDGSVMMPGNFEAEVRTLDVFVNAARAAERALARMADRRVFNTANGIRIRGAAPLPIADLELVGVPSDTRGVARNLIASRALRDRFAPATQWQMESMRRDVLATVDALIAEAECHPLSLEEGMGRLEALHRRLRASVVGRNGHVVEHLMRGSLAVFSQTLAQALDRVVDPDRALALHEECDAHFRRFLYDVRDCVLGDFISEDRRVRGVQEKLAV